MSPPKPVIDLVERFERDRKVFLSPDYKEEQLRAEFQAGPATEGRMRLTRLAACLVLLAMTLASGIEPEWTILLPDSLSGLPGPQCAAYNPMTDKVYVGGSGNCVLVIDCATNKKVARIATESGVTAMFCSPVNGRIYCVGELLTVIDGASDVVVETLRVNRSALCYNSRSQQLYAYGGFWGESPIVVDTRTDSVVDTMHVEAFSLCYNPHDDKVYCRTESDVRILGGRDGAFIANVPVGGARRWSEYGPRGNSTDLVRSLCYNPTSNKVYCANYVNRNVTVIDGGTNQVLDTIIAEVGLTGICCNPRNNKIYLANGAHAPTPLDFEKAIKVKVVGGVRYIEDPNWPRPETGDSTVSVIDGATDKIITTVRTHGRPMVLSYDSASNGVLAACEAGPVPESLLRQWKPARGRPSVDIIDGTSNRLTASAALSQQAVAFCFDPRRGYAYCVAPDRDQPDVAALRVASGEVIAHVPTARHPGALCYNPRDNKLYCSIRGDGELVVLDGTTNRLLTTLKIGRDPWHLCYNSKENKIYCDEAYNTRVLVLDGKTDSVISSLMMGSPVWYDSLNNWVYSFKSIWNDGRIAVTDGTTGGTIAEVPFHGPWSFCGNPKANKVYCHSDQTGELAIIDGPTHALIKTIQIGTGRHVLCCDDKDNKVYCAYETMRVIDCNTNAVDTSWFMPARAMCYNARNNKFYVGGRLGLSVLDATTNRVIANFSEYAGAKNIYYNAGDNCVYCVCNDLVVVLDGASNEILRTYTVGHDMHVLACNTKQNRIYVANQDGYDISVIRGGGP